MVTAMVLELDSRRFVALLDDVDQFAEISKMPGMDLDSALGFDAADAERHAVSLVLGKIATSSAARLKFHEIADDRFYKLPRLLQRVGCADWVRGLVLMGDDEPPAVWIDLSQLCGLPGGPS